MMGRGWAKGMGPPAAALGLNPASKRGSWISGAVIFVFGVPYT